MATHDEAFSVDARGGDLVRSVTPALGRGRPYTHRCTLDAYERVAHAFDELPEDTPGLTLEAIAAAEGLPCTQVATALAFLKERGCVVPHGRASRPASPDVHLHAMLEYHALLDATR